MGKVRDADFDQEVLQHGQPVLVDFWATWCGPCLTMAPIVEELAEEHTDRVKVVKMDVDQNPETARTYGISAIPTFIVFHEGKEVTRYKGSTSKRGLESMLEQVAAVKEPASTLPTPPNP
ncbi:MAG: thioredoxin [Limisphaerales bacterium]